MDADLILLFFRQTVLVFLEVLGFAFFLRAILSWFDPMGEWRISGFLYALTEPITIPIRALCERMDWFQGVPMDIPFTLTWLLLMLLQILLGVL
jgi:uncharacterized protein YggT (Ycf19 family)